MSANPFVQLLQETPRDEELVRRGLALLEHDFRRLTFLALARWQDLGIAAAELLPAIAAIQRPQWGACNGLLTAIADVRARLLQNGTAAQRQAIQSADLLGKIVSTLDHAIEPATIKILQPLAECIHVPLVSDSRLKQVLAMPIVLDARIEEAQPSDWPAIAVAFKPLLEFHARVDPCEFVREIGHLPSPWFVSDGDQVRTFAGRAPDFSAAYVSASGDRETRPLMTPQVQSALGRLLGQADADELEEKLSLLGAADAHGVILGDFLVGPPVGEGGFGTVHVGRQISTGRKVAIKILHDGMSAEESARFQREAAYLARFNHPNIVGVLGYGRESWLLRRDEDLSREPWYQEFRLSSMKTFIAMEWVDGRTLEAVYRDAKQDAAAAPGVNVLAEWFAQAASALAAVHALGLIHRDVKPSNIMITADGIIKLMDFGIARPQHDNRTLLTAAGKVFGTLPYMSPEQVRAVDSDSAVGPATDIYSLCAAFYELYTLTRFLQHDTQSIATLHTMKINGVLPPRPRSLTRALPWEIETILMGGLENDVADRYRSMSALEQDLRRFLGDEPIRYRRPSLWRRTRLGYRRNRAIANLLIAFGLIAVAATAFYIRQITREQARTLVQRDLAKSNEQQAKQSLSRAELLNANFLSGSGNRREALAHLGRALREDPGNAAAAARAAWMLASTRLPLEMRSAAGVDAILAPLAGDGRDYPAFSPDGAWAATGDFNGAVRVFNVRTGQLAYPPLKHDGPVNCVAFSPDGARILTASSDNAARIWDSRTGRLIVGPIAHANWVTHALFSSDGLRIVTVCRDQTARVWDATSGQPITPAVLHKDWISCVAFSPDGKRFATGCGDHAVRVWDARTGQPAIDPLKHDDLVTSVAFSPDGSRLLSASWDKTARLWDGGTGRAIIDPLAHGAVVRRAAFSADGLRIITASDDRAACIWDACTGQSIGQPLLHDDAVMAAGFTADGARVVTAGADGTIRIFSAAAARPLPLRLRHDDTQIDAASFSPDGTRIVTAGHDGAARIWDAMTGRQMLLLRHDGVVYFAAFSPDGTRIVTGASDQAARVWDAGTGQLIAEPMKHQPVTGVVDWAAFSPDGARIITAGRDGMARVWDARTAQPATPWLKHDGVVNMAIFSPDGTRVATASDDESARLWDARSGAPLGEPMKHAGGVLSVAFSPDGTRLLTAGRDDAARLWDASTGRPAGEPLRHTGTVACATFSPDGTRIVTASWDKTARLWDAAGKPLAEPLRHEGIATWAAFSRDGQRLVTCSADGTARVWDAHTGQPLADPVRHARMIQTAAFDPTGARLVTAGVEQSACVWDIAPPAAPPAWLADFAEAAAGARFADDGTRRAVVWSPGALMSLIDPAGQDAWSAWGRWLLAAPSTRPISPLAALTIARRVQSLLDENTAESLQEAIALDPNNALCLARLGSRLVETEPSPTSTAALYADLYTRRAVELSPANAEIQRLRAEVVRRVKGN